MSLVPVQVELPQYAQSFSINVPLNGSILDIKEEISRSVPGKPRVEGQRLIAQGRVLSDSEVVDQLWKSAEDSRVVHLAVSPTSWTAGAPELGRVHAAATSTSVAASPEPSTLPNGSTSSATALASTAVKTVTSRHPDLAFLRIQHHNALCILQNKAISSITSHRRQQLRNVTAAAVANAGLAWPSVLDEEYPPQIEGVVGANYKPISVDGRDYLQLDSSSQPPTARQKLALKVLTHTFPLLSAPIPMLDYTHVPSNDLRFSLPNHQIPANAIVPGQPLVIANDANVNIINLNPALNGNANANEPGAAGARMRAVVQIREMPVRALLTPLILLCLRTLLLFYFISPARKPLIGIMLGAWVLYEAWGAVRGAIVDLNEMARNVDTQPRPNPPNNAPVQAGAGAAAPPNAPPAPGNPAPTPTRAPDVTASNADIVLTRLSSLNLNSETHALYPPENSRAPEEPSIIHKAKLFVSLIVLTLHPAVWNRRRATLRVREGRLRTEGRAMNEEGEADERAIQARERMNAVHMRRPRWVREYMERVMVDDWVDD